MWGFFNIVIARVVVNSLAVLKPTQTKHFATSFCTRCGSSLPCLSKNGKAVIVPAGTLDDDPQIRPMQNIFCDSKAPWYQELSELLYFEQLPPRAN